MTIKELNVPVHDGKYVIRRLAGFPTTSILLRGKELMMHIAFETENPDIEKVITALAEDLQEARQNTDAITRMYTASIREQYDRHDRPQSPPVFYKYRNVVYNYGHQTLAQVISDQGDEWELVAISSASPYETVVVFRAIRSPAS